MMKIAGICAARVKLESEECSKHEVRKVTNMLNGKIA